MHTTPAPTLPLVPPRGRVRLWSVDADGRPLQLIQEKHNLVTYQGADTLAKLIGGDWTYQLNGMYFQYYNASGAATVNPQRTDDVSIFTGLTGNNDAVRVPIIGGAGFSSTDQSKYDFNTATLWAVSAASTGAFRSLAFGSGANSRIIGAALVSMPDINDKTKDRIFARVALTEFALVSAASVGVQWDVSPV